jgi:chromosome segregation ATPase
MSDNPQADATPADADATPQAGTDDAPAVESISLDEAKKLRSEAASLRKRLAAFEKAEADRKSAELSEVERIKQELDARDTDLTTARQELRNLKAQALASRAGALYPDLVADKLSDEALNGDKAAQDKELTRLRKDYPQLFRGGSADGGAGRESDPPGDMNALVRRLAGRG